MNPLHALLQRITADNEREIAELRSARASVRKEADRVVNRGEEEAWATIVRKADRLVEKDSSLTRAGAVERYLRSDAGKIDYQRYLDASRQRVEVVAKSASAVNERDLQTWAKAQYLSVIEKSAHLSYEEADDYAQRYLGDEIMKLAKEAE